MQKLSRIQGTSDEDASISVGTHWKDAACQACRRSTAWCSIGCSRSPIGPPRTGGRHPVWFSAIRIIEPIHSVSAQLLHRPRCLCARGPYFLLGLLPAVRVFTGSRLVVFGDSLGWPRKDLIHTSRSVGVYTITLTSGAFGGT